MTDQASNPAVDTSAAEAFEKYLVPVIFGPWSRALVDHTSPRDGERLLDIGCGTGVAARYAAGIVGKTTAIDLNAGMIAHARTLDPENLVEWHEDTILELPFDDDSFDIVVGNQVLQFVPDRAKALSEVRRVLAPGGRLALTVFCDIELCPGHCAVAKALEKHNVDPSGIQIPYSFGDPVVLGDVIQQAGFRDVSVVRRTMEARFATAEKFVDALAAGGPSSRHALEQLDGTGLREVIAEVTETLAQYTDNDGVRILTAANMALAGV
jgi:ubiquinone/menaquinone biosynthesis C-methylase UbiE